MAGARTSASGARPKRAWSASQPSTQPGTGAVRRSPWKGMVVCPSARSAVASTPDPLDGEPLTILVGAGSVTIADGEGPEGPGLFIGLLDGRPCWAVDIELPGGTPLMGLYGAVDDDTWTIAGRAVQLVEWTRTHR